MTENWSQRRMAICELLTCTGGSRSMTAKKTIDIHI